MYICTFPRMRTLATLFAAFAAVMMAPPSFAQNGGNSAQAELHINVIVMPVVLPPRDHRHRDKDRDRDKDSVSYDLSPQEERLSVTEDVRPMLVNSSASLAKEEPVRVITVVVK